MENKLGTHVIAELTGCPFDLLDDVEFAKRELPLAAIESGATVLSTTVHKFSPQGLSGVCVLSESHASLHSWPERGYLMVDCLTCGSHVNPIKAMDYLAKVFKAKDYRFKIIHRGDGPNHPEIQE